MPGKRYSAGAIFLQVVPVFGNVQRAIEDEAKNIDRALGDQMEKSGEKAGEKAGKAASKAMKKEIDEGAKTLSGSFEREFHKSIDEVNKAIGGINTRKLSNDMRREIAEIKREMAAIKDLDLTVDLDKRQADASLAELEGRLRAFRDVAKIVFRADIDNALKGFAKIEAAKDRIEDPVEIEVSTDFKVAERELSSFEKNFKKTTEKARDALKGNLGKGLKEAADDIKALGMLRIGVDISSNRARAELKEIADDLEKAASKSTDIDFKIAATQAWSELAALEATLAKLDEQDIDIDVKVDSAQVRKAARAGDEAANSFRSFNIVLLAATGAGPALVPILAAIAGGLLALGPAAAVGAFGLGAVLVGFSGIGDALGALQAQQDQAATGATAAAAKQVGAANAIADATDAVADAERNAARAAEDAADRVADARRNAARAAEDAAERVADAREAAADAIEDALERQKDAQEEYRDAVQEVADAEQALRDARTEAAKDAADLATRQRQNAVDERQAVLDLFDAQTAYNAVMGDPGATATDKERASVDLEQAQIALNGTRTEQQELAAEAADYAKNGVEGSEKVKTAQDNLTDALEAQKEAQEAVAKAAKEARDAQVEGAEDVKEALEDQREVISDNARAISEALEAQRETHADNARAIEDAKEALSRARESAVDDLGQIDAQAQAVKTAFDKLGPAGATFALFLFSLREGFYDFRDAVQQAMLPAVQEAIEGFASSANAGSAAAGIVALAGAFGEFTKALSESFQGEAWGKFFGMLSEFGPAISEAYGAAFISVMEAFASILTVAAPFALEFAEGLAKMMEQFAAWAGSKEGSDDILAFIDYVKEIGPDVVAFFFALGGAIVQAAKALAPYGELILNMLTNVAELIAETPIELLGPLLAGLTALLFASQVAYGVMNLLMAGRALLLSTLGPWVFAIVAVGIALAYLWKTNEGFRDFITEAWERISKVLKKAWEDDIKPALMELWEALQDLWKEVLEPFFQWLGPKLLWLIENVLPLLARIWAEKIRFIARMINIVLIPVVTAMADAFIWLWEKVLKPVWGFIKDEAQFLWKESLKPAFQGISKLWKDALDEMEWVWDNVLKPTWNFITETALPALQTAFEVALGAIGLLWDELKRTVGAPIKFVLDTIINDGLIAGFNKVAGWVGQDGLDKIAIPEAIQKYATGGVLPGYTPGRDPHVFHSPTAGTLALSGGEAIMRPEWTAAMGTGYVDQMNKIAANGGIQGIKKAMGFATGGIVQAFAKGGVVWPVPGGYVNRSEYNLGHDGMDINHPADAGPSGQGGVVPFYSATSGVVTSTGYARGYGNAVFVNSPYGELVYGHAYDGSIGVGPGRPVTAGQYLGMIGNTGNSSGAHLHFGFPGGSFYAAEALLNGSAMPNPEDIKGGGKGISLPTLPSWMKSILKDPLGAVKGWITNPIKDAAASFANTPMFESLSAVPKLLAKSVTDKVWDITPGWAKTAAGWAGGAANWAVGGVKNAADKVGDTVGDIAGGVQNGAGAVADALGFAKGGILPYNGTMMYDSGGYLPPGLTTVMNLTGKPEPVFTADQFKDLNVGGGEGGFTYAPTINGSDLTAADLVDDLDFNRRKVQREGRYSRSKPS